MANRAMWGSKTGVQYANVFVICLICMLEAVVRTTVLC